jgi:hypothetical protein
MTWENDSLMFSFNPSDYFWKVNVENKTGNKAFIQWDNALFIRNKKSSKVVFDSTIRFKMNDPLGESTIASKSEIGKSIYPVDLWWETEPYPVFKKKNIKKEGDMVVRILIPVSFDGKIKDYEFNFVISNCEQ